MFRNRLGMLSKAAIVAAAIAINLVALAAVTPTFAQTPTPTTSERATGLQRQFHRDQIWFGTQTQRLANANKVATNVQNYINAQNSKGKDTSSLTAALTTFNSQIATAQSSHTLAGNTIAAHAGFDASGNVTDVSQAAQTVITARQSLMDAHRTIRQAVVDLHRTLRAYRKANAGS